MKFSDAINEVRLRVDIYDVVSKYVRLTQSGNNYIGLCPFHNEKTPSFIVSKSKQIFKCFGCGIGGNVYKFLQEYEGISFPDAVKMLAKQVNVIIDDDYVQNSELTKKREILYKLYKDVANEYYKCLYSNDGKTGYEYFKSRKLTDVTIKKFGLGFAPKSYGYMYNKMKEKGYVDSVLMDSRLFFLGEKGAHDFFYDRVMFPLVDSYGNIVSFQGRILIGNEQKYINTSENIIYKKSKHLFGINFAKQSKEDYYILCEGNMDVITLHQAGFDNAIASWGTAFTEGQANLIKRKVKKVYLCQDTDAAGLKAIESAASICEAAGIETYVLDLNPAKDPDEYINKYGKEAFKEKLDKPISSFLFLISVLKKQFDLSNAYDYEKYIKTIVKRLAKFDNAMIREKYIKDVSIQENLSYEELLRQTEKNSYGIIDSNTKAEINDNLFNKSHLTENEKIERLYVSLIIDYPNLRDKSYDVLKTNEFNDHISKFIYEKYLDNITANGISDLSNDLSDEDKECVQSIIFNRDNISNMLSEPYDTKNDNINIKTKLNELVKKIKIRNIKSASSNLKSMLENNIMIKDIENTIYF